MLRFLALKGYVRGLCKRSQQVYYMLLLLVCCALFYGKAICSFVIVLVTNGFK